MLPRRKLHSGINNSELLILNNKIHPLNNNIRRYNLIIAHVNIHCSVDLMDPNKTKTILKQRKTTTNFERYILKIYVNINKFQ